MKNWTITENTVIGADVGIQIAASKDLNITVSGNKIDATQGIVMREERSFLEELGLPADTPPEEVRELLVALQQSDASSVEREEVIRRSRLWGRIQNYANAATILGVINSLGASVITAALASVRGC